MLTPEMKELADRLVKLIEEDADYDSGPPVVTVEEVRDICHALLNAVEADDMGGCALCLN